MKQVNSNWKDKFPKENRYFETRNGILYKGDVLEILRTLPDESVDTIITSPPYWGLRDYGVEGQIGLEPTLAEYLEKLLEVTAELKRVLKKTGVMFWNHGDCYSGSLRGYGRDGQNYTTSKIQLGNKGSLVLPPNWELNKVKPKSMCMQNYRLVLRMIDEQGWILRNIIIWYKPNHMPSSAKDRFTNAYEPVFMLVKSRKYWFDLDAVRLPHKTTTRANITPSAVALNQKHINHRMRAGGHLLGKNPGDVWEIPIQPFPEAHFATYPEKLVEPMIKAGCPQWICQKCGKPRERIVKVYRPPDYNPSCKAPYADKVHSNWNNRPVSKIYFDTLRSKRQTIGWTDCGCNAGWKPGIVLDPFMGSGTTALVAEKMNRNWIGIEINPEYCEIAKQRIIEVLKQKQQLSMFA